MPEADVFEPIPGSHIGSVRCKVCGASGPGPINPALGITPEPRRWQKNCIAGHPFECACGRKFSTAQGLSQHVRADRIKPGCAVFVPQIDIWKKWIDAHG